jgi:5'-3' exonuclease
LSEQASENFKRVLKEKLKEHEKKKGEGYKDPVRLGEVGWKDRYYLDKFKVSNDDSEFKELIKKSYIEGICWVFAYYFNGCPSWEWYYPFHYAPFASDICDLDTISISFDMGTPYQPIEQLLSVLPPYSSKALPACLREYMHDPESEIADFYPSNIRLDQNGHIYSWMGVNLIPFVDEWRIREVVRKNSHKLTPEEEKRNKLGNTEVYYNKLHILNELIGDKKGEHTLKTERFRIFSASLRKLERIEIEHSIEIKSNHPSILIYTNPAHDLHSNTILRGVKIPRKVVDEDNIEMYSKKNFKGDQAIDIVKRVLGYQDEAYSEARFKNSLFDRSFNNNRAIEYDPQEMEMLRKKTYRERHPEEFDDKKKKPAYDKNGPPQGRYPANQQQMYQNMNNYNQPNFYNPNYMQQFIPNQNMNQMNPYMQFPVNNQNINQMYPPPNYNTQFQQMPNINTPQNLNRTNNQNITNLTNNQNPNMNSTIDNILKSYQNYIGNNSNNK